MPSCHFEFSAPYFTTSHQNMGSPCATVCGHVPAPASTSWDEAATWQMLREYVLGLCPCLTPQQPFPQLLEGWMA